MGSSPAASSSRPAVRRSSLLRLGALWGLLSAATPVVRAQDALKHFLTGEEAAAEQKLALENQEYNLQMGDVRFQVEASATAEYNDNFRLSNHDRQEDLIFRPQLRNRAFWPITERNSINFSMGLGFTKYLDHSRYDYFVITPGSQLSFDVYVKDVRLNFFDRLSFSEDPLENGAVSNAARYGGLRNLAGVNANWDLRQVALTTEYAHENFVANQSEFSYLSHSAENLVARAGAQVHPALLVGPELSANLTSYNERFLNDVFSYSAGAFARARLTSNLRINAHAAYAWYSFDSNGRSRTPEDQTAYNFGITLNHTLNAILNHSLNAGHSVSAGTYSNFQELDYVTYKIALGLIRDVKVEANLFYEEGSYPPIFASSGAGSLPVPEGETYDRFGASINFTYRLLERVNATLGYRFTLKDSNVQVRDYTQNAFSLGVTYKF